MQIDILWNCSVTVLFQPEGAWQAGSFQSCQRGGWAGSRDLMLGGWMLTTEPTLFPSEVKFLHLFSLQPTGPYKNARKWPQPPPPLYSLPTGFVDDPAPGSCLRTSALLHTSPAERVWRHLQEESRLPDRQMALCEAEEACLQTISTTLVSRCSTNNLELRALSGDDCKGPRSSAPPGQPCGPCRVPPLPGHHH